MSHFSKHYPFPFTITLFCSVGGHVFLAVALLVLGLIPIKSPPRINWLSQGTTVMRPMGPLIKGKTEAPLGVPRAMEVVNAQPARPKPQATPAPAPKTEPDAGKKIVVPTKEPVKSERKTPVLGKKVISTAPKVKEPLKKPPPLLPSIPSFTGNNSNRDTRVADAGARAQFPPLPYPDSGRPFVAAKGDPNGSSGNPTGQIQTEGDVFLPYDYGADAQARIQLNFSPPSSLKSRESSACVLRFRIHRDGTMDMIEVLQSAGAARLDDFAKQALIQTQALLPLPSTVTKDAIFLRVSFSFGEGGQ